MVLIPTGLAGKICLGLAVIGMLESTLRAYLTGILGVYSNLSAHHGIATAWPNQTLLERRPLVAILLRCVSWWSPNQHLENLHWAAKDSPWRGCQAAYIPAL